MDEIKKYYGASELAGMQLVGLPSAIKNIIAKAERENWPSRKRQGRGGGFEYQPPAIVLEQIRQKVLLNIASGAVATTELVANAALPVPDVIPDLAPQVAVSSRGISRQVKEDSALTDKERAQRDAALVVCRAIDAAVAATGCSVHRACTELGIRIADDIANPELIAAARTMWVKPRADGWTAAKISNRISKVYPLYVKGCQAGNPCLYLVPGKREKDGHRQIDVIAFLTHYCRPTRPPVAEAWRQSEKWYAERNFKRPSVTVFNRIQQELPVTVKYRGRVTGSEWRSLKPYVERDVSMFKSNDIWVGDGHSFKAKVSHPVHGQPFVPEVTVIIDWRSRKAVGWSVSLAESTLAVADAFRHAQWQTRARPLIYYSDNGSGQTGLMIDHPITGTLARQGIAHETGIPGNPQARGIIERLWQFTLIPLARTYPTCTWRGADKESVRQMLAELDTKTSRVSVPSWKQFLDDVDAALTKYNTEHRHSELKGMTPEQAYERFLDPGSLVFSPNDSELAQLWMPEAVRKPSRGMISLFGNTYCNRDLPSILAEGESVRVRFDIHNADAVWLYRMDGRFIGTAEWDSHKKAAFAVPYVDDLRDKRMDGKVERGQRIIDEAEAERAYLVEMEADSIFEIPGVGTITRETLEEVGGFVVNQAAEFQPAAQIDMAAPQSTQQANEELAEDAREPEIWQVPRNAQDRFQMWCTYHDMEKAGKGIPDPALNWYQNYPFSKEYLGLANGNQLVA